MGTLCVALCTLMPHSHLLKLTGIHCVSEDLIDVKFTHVKQYLQYFQLEGNKGSVRAVG